MKTTIFIFLFLGMLGCSNPKSTEDSSTITDTKAAEADSADDSEELIDIPELGMLEFGNQWLDSMRSYGAGDCFGEIYHYTKQGQYYAADSLTCGEYGFTFTHYLMDSSGFLLKARELKWESLINEQGDNYTHVLTEHVYDFQSEPEVILQRTDTLDDHYVNTAFPEHVQKQFKKQSLELKESIYESIMFRYQKAWSR
ncbi:MAG: hypothetical protein P8X57_09410 [Cyclobacteriaceae bacterium]